MSPHILLVDNDERQSIPLRTELVQEGWEVTEARDKDDAEYRLRILRDSRKSLDAVAVDLGLPPLRDDTTIGVALIQAIRSDPKTHDLPVLAYTALANLDIASDLRRMLVWGVSFIYLRSLPFPFPQVMEYVRLGFVIYSPSQVMNLPNAITDRPDPLDDALWDTLRALAGAPTQAVAARELNVATETIKTRLEKIRQILVARSEISLDAPSPARELAEWYRHNRVRYARP